MYQKIGMLACILVLTLVACRQDKEVINREVIINSEPAVYVNTSITGVVSDEDGNPIEGVLITVDQEQTNTDDNGFFYLKDIQANKNGASVQAERSGFFTTSKLIYPSLNRVEYVEITMLESKEGGRLQANDGGDVAFGQGAKVSFPPQAFMLDGIPYDGEAVIHTSYINPTASDLYEVMPGSLIGIDDEGVVRGMETFGMIGVELFTPAGQELEIAPGKSATLTFPLSSDLEAEAESTIALWHYDEQSAYWAQQGTAIKNGASYVAEVTHFSFWNCDAPFDLVNCTGTVQTANGQAVINTRVEIERKGVATRGTGTAYTNYIGQYNGKIPSAENLVLRVYNLCDELVHSEDIGPFYADTDLGVVEVDFPEELNIEGTVVNCDNEPVSNGYAMVRVGETVLPVLANADGRFSATMGVCNPGEVIVTAHDLDGQQKSTEYIFGYAQNLDVGQIQACGTIIYTMELDIDGEFIVLDNCFTYYLPDSAGNPASVYVGAEGGQGFANITIQSDGVGTGPVVQFNVGLLAFPNVRFTDLNLTGEVTDYDPAPSVARGNFSGTAVNSNTQLTVDISGNFTAERN